MAWRQRQYDRALVETILFHSEGRPTTFRSQAPGHAYGTHVQATRAGMQSHALATVQIATAFLPDRNQQVTAAVAVLNNHVGQGALNYLDYGGRAGRRVIVEAVMPEITVRCADAVKNWTELAGAACMVIDSTTAGDGIHIHTFYPIRYNDARDVYGRRPLYRRGCPSWWTTDPQMPL
jgi:hypothetical protein